MKSMSGERDRKEWKIRQHRGRGNVQIVSGLSMAF
jgi:hypothetical protein